MHAWHDIAFTGPVRALQEAAGSRPNYARMGEGPGARNHRLGAEEAAFLGRRDSFYLASVGATGWPYIQHRGGPRGFVRVLDEATVGFADFRGNRQFVTLGNLAGDDRVALFFMDYPNRTRLKLFGHARAVEDDPALLARLAPQGTAARTERAVLVRIAAFDWNCPQYITPRWTQAEIGDLHAGPDGAGAA
jgi:predicted pyridoxine 5'-phosphate oxidase superfamily flavin-nucleotide-binding protein